MHKEEINQLIHLSETDSSNKFIINGNNNIFRNSELWLEDTSNINYFYQSDTMHVRDDLYLLAESYYEFWHGKIYKMKEDKVSNRASILL